MYTGDIMTGLLKKLSHRFLYGVLFVGAAYVLSVLPSALTRLYSHDAPVVPFASADHPGGGWDSGDCDSDGGSDAGGGSGSGDCDGGI